ncbi:MAG: hypothetical protein G8345_15335 [Magnetococcales bacterium]|nr:hypothetical protein [Magnetococcales bacterium]NGZ28250.1 hypothetical protein [Magnetococcales bacterium]
MQSFIREMDWVIKNSTTTPASRNDSEGSEVQKIRALPSVTLEDAAWLAGITPEALQGFLEAAAIKTAATDGSTRVAVSDLIRGGFSVASRRETQVTMLRTQLHSALEREKALANALQLQLGKPAHGWEEGEGERLESKPEEPPAAPTVNRVERARGKGKKR